MLAPQTVMCIMHGAVMLPVYRNFFAHVPVDRICSLDHSQATWPGNEAKQSHGIIIMV